MGFLGELSDALEPRNPRAAQRRSSEDIAELNNAAREAAFDSFGSGLLGRPYVTTRPDSARLVIPAGTHAVPGRKAAEHQVRLTKFNASPRGILFNTQQSVLQTQQSRRLTRFFDPGSLQRSALSIAVSEKRHAERDDRVVTEVVGRAGDLIGFDETTPRDASREEEIRAVTGGRGYLRNQVPDLSEPAAGAEYRARARASIASRLEDLNPDRWTRLPFGAQALRREVARAEGGEYDSVVGMASTRGPGGVPVFDRYNPTFPRLSRDGDAVVTPDGTPNVQRPEGAAERYRTLIEERDVSRSEARADPARFRLGGGLTPYSYAEGLPGPEADVYGSEGEEARLFRENRIETGRDAEGGERYILHRRPRRFGQSTYGLPNYSLADLSEDAVNAIPVQDYDPRQPEEPTFDAGGGEEVRQLVSFRVYDIVNRKRVVLRAYVQGVSVSNEVEWSSEQYIGRPEKYHIYGGNARSLSFSFRVYAESEASQVAVWRKVNYLQGMLYPAAYAALPGGGAYMIAPFAQLTLGSLYVRQPGFIQSMDLDLSDDFPWDLRTGRQLPKGLDASVTYTIIEQRLPRTGQRFFDADFIEEI